VRRSVGDGASTMPRPSTPRSSRARLPKDVVLLQLALLFQSGARLTYERLTSEFGLERRTAERYIRDLRDAGLPIVPVQRGRAVEFALHALRTKMDVEAIDVSPAVAKSLTLLVVAAALLPANLGVREAVDRTVRAALRVRGMRLAGELRRLEDAVLVLENDAKDYTGREDIFAALFDAVLEGRLVAVDYTSPRSGVEHARFFPASIGLYRGGLYVLGVDEGDDGGAARWWALERFDDVPVVVGEGRLAAAARHRALAAARRRWGPARARDEFVVTLAFSAAAAPYVRARPWHAAVDMAPDDGGGIRMSMRLAGETLMLESWLKSWGSEVQVLRPRWLAERLAADLDRAAARHRAAAADFERLLHDDDHDPAVQPGNGDDDDEAPP
jgi:predicted DNA-binding transcriptional regulator YafY